MAAILFELGRRCTSFVVDVFCTISLPQRLLCVFVAAALSGIATDVEVSIHEIQTLLDEEDKQEKEFQVEISHVICIDIDYFTRLTALFPGLSR